MKDNWSFVWTLQFVVGTLIAGLFLNIVGAYVVRGLDSVARRLGISFRNVRQRENDRTQTLANAALGDNTLWSALAAESARLRSHELLNFFVALVSVSVLILLATTIQLAQPVTLTSLDRVQVVAVVVFLVALGVFNYSSGTENGRRAKRLDSALRAVHRDRSLPIMD